MKEATNKAGLFMFVMFLAVIILIIGIFVIVKGNDSEFEKLTDGFTKLVGSVFPKFSQLQPSANI